MARSCARPGGGVIAVVGHFGAALPGPPRMRLVATGADLDFLCSVDRSLGIGRSRASVGDLQGLENSTRRNLDCRAQK